MCNCQQLAQIVQGNDEYNPLGELQELEWSPERWATLNQCSECGQLWHIDIAKQNEIGLCIKVPDQASWKTLDPTQIRLQLMVQNRGGLSDETCKWKQCNERCVKGLAFCPVHAYFEMDIKA
ncbi:MAG: metal-binding protein [Kangiellaceae bacterium]|nr:metal-binding protein [Kangiellaceae bacterium]